MKLAEKEMKHLVSIFLKLAWGIHKVEDCLEGIGINISITGISPLDIGKLGDFVLDMFEVPRDTGAKKVGQQFHRDWFYMEIYGNKDFELTDENLERRTNEVYGMLKDWQGSSDEHIGLDKAGQSN
jgi:hypothetical protein